jgi:hypothetical protein
MQFQSLDAVSTYREFFDQLRGKLGQNPRFDQKEGLPHSIDVII